MTESVGLLVLRELESATQAAVRLCQTCMQRWRYPYFPALTSSPLSSPLHRHLNDKSIDYVTNTRVNVFPEWLAALLGLDFLNL
jgi:hypothetical protein